MAQNSYITYNYPYWTTAATGTTYPTTWQYIQLQNVSYQPNPTPPVKIRGGHYFDDGHEEFAWLDSRISEICDYAFA